MCVSLLRIYSGAVVVTFVVEACARPKAGVTHRLPSSYSSFWQWYGARSRIENMWRPCILFCVCCLCSKSKSQRQMHCPGTNSFYIARCIWKSWEGGRVLQAVFEWMTRSGRWELKRVPRVNQVAHQPRLHFLASEGRRKPQEARLSRHAEP